jgi:predicted solute-binding protein
MAPDVIQQHIDLYVNDYTQELDAAAVERLIKLGEDAGLYAKPRTPIFAYEG